jgi:hypothetical protein
MEEATRRAVCQALWAALRQSNLGEYPEVHMVPRCWPGYCVLRGVGFVRRRQLAHTLVGQAINRCWERLGYKTTNKGSANKHLGANDKIFTQRVGLSHRGLPKQL